MEKSFHPLFLATPKPMIRDTQFENHCVRIRDIMAMDTVIK
jgi:hypothetical protein